MEAIVTFQHYKAPQDPNGNPRRLFVGHNAIGDIVIVTDEGYSGRPAWVRNLPELPNVTITATLYRSMLRDFGDLSDDTDEDEADTYSWSNASALWQVRHGTPADPRTASAAAYIEAKLAEVQS